MKDPLGSARYRKKFIKGLKNIATEVKVINYPCPFPCNGHIMLLTVEKGKEITTPSGFKQQQQYMCSLCGATWLGTSKKAISKLVYTQAQPLYRLQLKAWRIKHAHGKWVEKGWRGRKYVFDGYQ